MDGKAAGGVDVVVDDADMAEIDVLGVDQAVVGAICASIRNDPLVAVPEAGALQSSAPSA